MLDALEDVVTKQICVIKEIGYTNLARRQQKKIDMINVNFTEFKPFKNFCVMDGDGHNFWIRAEKLVRK